MSEPKAVIDLVNGKWRVMVGKGLGVVEFDSSIKAEVYCRQKQLHVEWTLTAARQRQVQDYQPSRSFGTKI